MDWKTVGDWLKNNAGASTVLVGSLLSGNIPAAVAAGVSLVSSATGQVDPIKAMDALKSDPATMVRLRELALQEEASIREHIRALEELKLKDIQLSHEQTQATIRNGDNAEDVVVRRTRPLQSWVSMFAAVAYALMYQNPDATILGLLLTLPCAYAGLRQIGKGIDSVHKSKTD